MGPERVGILNLGLFDVTWERSPNNRMLLWPKQNSLTIALSTEAQISFHSPSSIVCPQKRTLDLVTLLDLPRMSQQKIWPTARG